MKVENLDKLKEIWIKRTDKLQTQVEIYRKQNMRLEELATIRLINAINQCERDLRYTISDDMNIIKNDYEYQV